MTPELTETILPAADSSPLAGGTRRVPRDCSSADGPRGIKPAPSVSVVVPVHNEAENVEILASQIEVALSETDRRFEIIFVDDGSTDGTESAVESLTEQIPATVSIVLRRNFGQTAAIAAGIDHANGDVVVLIDGDLQNDPADIPAMLELLDSGHDIVFGWREKRNDNWSRKLVSKVANWLIRRCTGTRVNDLGCGLKAMTRSVARKLQLTGDMHRFVAVLADQIGVRSAEIKVNHRARKHGTSKYGFERTTRVLLDLLTLSALQHRHHPMQFFGGWAIRTFIGNGLLLAATGGAGLIWPNFPAVWWMVAVVLLTSVIVVQLMALGVLAEWQVRQQADTASLPLYHVRRLTGHGLNSIADNRDQ